MQRLRSFIDGQAGATAIEYGLIAGFLSVVIVIAVTLIGTTLQATFDTIGTSLAP